MKRKAKDNRINPPKIYLFRTTLFGKSQSSNNKTTTKPAKTRGNSLNPPIPKHEAARRTHKRVNNTSFILGLKGFIIIPQYSVFK